MHSLFPLPLVFSTFTSTLLASSTLTVFDAAAAKMVQGVRVAATLSRTAAAGPSFRPMVAAIARPCMAVSTGIAQQSRGFKMPSLPFNLWPKRNPTASEPSTAVTAESAAPAASSEASSESLFDQVAKEEESSAAGTRKKQQSEHRYSTATFKHSHRKLNKLSRQIAGQPVDEAILQMAFSEKRASGRIKSTLALARDHAVDKGLRRERLVVAETWISKGPKIGRINIHGRARMGIKHHGSAKLYVVLREGKTRQEKQEKQRKAELNKIRSAGVVREDGVLRRKTISQWAW